MTSNSFVSRKFGLVYATLSLMYTVHTELSITDSDMINVINGRNRKLVAIYSCDEPYTFPFLSARS